MSTLAEVRKFLRQRQMDMRFFGVNPEFEAEFTRRAQEIHVAIVVENGLPPDTVQLPEDGNSVELGTRSEDLFNELVEWYGKNAEPEPEEAVGLS